VYGPCDITEVERVISWRRLGFTAVAPVTFAASAIVRYKGVRKITASSTPRTTS